MCRGWDNVREVGVQENARRDVENVLGCGGRCVRVEDSGGVRGNVGRSEGKVWGE